MASRRPHTRSPGLGQDSLRSSKEQRPRSPRTSASRRGSGRRRRSASSALRARERPCSSSARKPMTSGPRSACGSCPDQPGSGVRFQLGIKRGALPVAFGKAVEETVRQTLGEGRPRMAGARLRRHPSTHLPVHARRRVAAGASGRAEPGTSITWRPFVLVSALRRGGTRSTSRAPLSPQAPADTAWSVLQALARLGAAPSAAGPGPAARRHRGIRGRPGQRAGAAAAGPDPR